MSEKKETVKTCISLSPENAQMLERWHTETNLPKSELINMLIENAAKNKIELQVTYCLGS